MVKHRSSRIPKEPKPEPEDTFPEAVLPLRAGLPSEWNESGFDGAKEEEEEEGESTDLCAELKEQEETLVLLVDHYVNEVERLRLSVAHYQKELTEMERRLHESEAKLARVRSRNKVVSSQRDSRRSIFEEALAQQISDKSPEPGHEETSPRKRKSKQILVIPDVPVPPSFKKVSASIQGPECSSMTGANLASTRHFESPILNRAENSYGDPPDHGPIRSQASGIKRKKVCREHKELIPSVSTWSSPHLFHCHSSIHIPSQHKKKLRCLSLCPTNDRLFIT
ncbi:hypothetical protein Droror1_Dr00027161, partial [Drosera rotundifolia]